MAEEIIRLPVKFLSKEAQGEIRALGLELANLPRQAGRGIQAVNKELSTLGQTVKSLGGQLQSAVPILATLARAGPIGAVAAVAYGASRAFTDVGKSIVQLNHTARELGLTTQELRAFQTVAEKAGIAPEAMTQGLAAFRKNTEDFTLRVGSLREEMMAVGFGPVMERINKATTETEKLKEAWDMAEMLGRDSAAAKRLFDMLGLGADKLRFSFAEMQAEKARHPLLTEEEMARGKAYNDLMIDIGRAWDNLKQKFVLGLFSTDRLEAEKKRFEELGKNQAEIPGTPQTGGFAFEGPQFQHGGVMPDTGLALLHAGETVIPPGGDLLKGSNDTLTRTHTKGTYDALVQFASYQEATKAAGGGMAGLGGLPGMGGGGGGNLGAGGGPAPAGGGPAPAAGQAPATSGAFNPDAYKIPGAAPDGQTPSDAVRAGQVPGGPGGVPRSYERRKGEPGEFNYAATGAFGGPGQNLTTITLKNGQKATVNAAVADRFKNFANEMIDKGYPVDLRGGGGYANRGKAGGGGLSMHAYGTALDMNVSKNPFRGRTTDMPPDVEETAWKHGLSWGARFGDPMHFEAMGPTAAANKLKILQARSGATNRIDAANDAQAQPPTAKGTVDLSIKSDGTAGGGDAGKDLFQPSAVRNSQQMRPTEDGAAPGIGHQ